MLRALAAGQMNCFAAIPEQTAGSYSWLSAANFDTKHAPPPDLLGLRKSFRIHNVRAAEGVMSDWGLRIEAELSHFLEFLMEKTKGKTYRFGLDISANTWGITLLCGSGPANQVQDPGAQVWAFDCWVFWGFFKQTWRIKRSPTSFFNGWSNERWNVNIATRFSWQWNNIVSYNEVPVRQMSSLHYISF